MAKVDKVLERMPQVVKLCTKLRQCAQSVPKVEKVCKNWGNVPKPYKVFQKLGMCANGNVN